jgi:hypothetical protein
MKLKRIQFAINHYYDSIKLFLLVCIFGLVAYGLYYQNNVNSGEIQDRQKSQATIIDAIKNESEAQTKTINRQFKALCVIVVETSGQEGLDKLDADTRESCEKLADEPTQAKTTTPPVVAQKAPSPKE